LNVILPPFIRYNIPMPSPTRPLVLFLQIIVLGLIGLVAACSSVSSSTDAEVTTTTTTATATVTTATVAVAAADQNAGEQAEIPAPKVRHGDIVWIQERLQELGYYNGSADGAVGKATQSAVKVYQQDQGLESDGQITPELREFMWRNGG
jgi:peptidoglycan hydrolase-like protein with peptidoglycan-binding domain